MTADPHRRPRRAGQAIAFLAMACLALPAPVSPAPGPVPSPSEPAHVLRIAFTTQMMGQINEADAKAAIKAWAHTVLKTRGIPGEAAPLIVDTGGLIEGFRSGTVDLATMTTPEYLTLTELAPTAHLFLGVNKGVLGEEYLLLVHRDNPASSLAALRGAKLELYQHHAATLGPDWLDVMLLREGLPALNEHFGKVALRAKLSTAALPVFFGSSDACVVTRRGFETMVELNPQLGKTLKTLTASPRLVGSLFCFSAAYRSDLKDRVLRALSDLHQSPAGHQILTIFQTDALEQSDFDFAAERALLRERAEGRSKAARPGGLQSAVTRAIEER